MSVAPLVNMSVVLSVYNITADPYALASGVPNVTSVTSVTGVTAAGMVSGY